MESIYFEFLNENMISLSIFTLIRKISLIYFVTNNSRAISNQNNTNSMFNAKISLYVINNNIYRRIF